MIQNVNVDGQGVRLDPKALLGQGGEAYIYDLGGDRVLKVFRQPDDPMYLDDVGAQEAARRRLDVHQEKLRAFPVGAPDRMVGPTALATHGPRSRVVGYAMRKVSGDVLIRYSQPAYRRNVPQAAVLPILRDLWATVGKVHRAGIVVGDFNDQNVVVGPTGDAFLIDADSAQWGKFLCGTYMTRFVDPLLCDPGGSEPVLVKPHGVDSDWYAYSVIVAQSFLCVDPYGGVYNPPPGAPKVPHGARPLRRVTVWHPHVKYPKPATPSDVLPDELMEHFHMTFEKDRRGVFPVELLERMRWTTCSGCGAEHARATCPKVGCGTKAPAVAPVTKVTEVRGKVTATTVYQRRGVVVRADVRGGKLQTLCHEGGWLVREDGTKVVASPLLDPRLRARVTSDATYLAFGNQVAKVSKDGSPPTMRIVDTVRDVPVFQATDEALFWSEGGTFKREGRADLAPVVLGEVLDGQTRFWVGDKLGVGFYQADGVTVGFTFDASSRGACAIRDTVPVRIRGKLLDATAVVSGSRAWFLTETQEGTERVRRCSLVRSDGTVEATAEAKAGDGTWLGSTIRGAAAAGDMLLVPTDGGVVRVDAVASVGAGVGSIVPTREFPDSEPWVDSGSSLFACADGLYVLSGDRKEIVRLVMA